MRASGRSTLGLTASNQAPKGRTALPTGIAAALIATTEVTVQIHTSGAECFEAVLGTVTHSDATRFKAKTP